MGHAFVPVTPAALLCWQTRNLKFGPRLVENDPCALQGKSGRDRGYYHVGPASAGPKHPKGRKQHCKVAPSTMPLLSVDPMRVRAFECNAGNLGVRHETRDVLRYRSSPDAFGQIVCDPVSDELEGSSLPSTLRPRRIM